MHHGTCVTHVPWCMSGSLNRGGGENVPRIPGACTTRNITYLARGPWTVAYLLKFRKPWHWYRTMMNNFSPTILNDNSFSQAERCIDILLFPWFVSSPCLCISDCIFCGLTVKNKSFVLDVLHMIRCILYIVMCIIPGIITNKFYRQ